MRLSDLAAHVGADRFQQACALALTTAVGTGTRLGRDEWPPDLSAVPHELADLVENDLPLAFELYRAMAVGHSRAVLWIDGGGGLRWPGAACPTTFTKCAAEAPMSRVARSAIAKRRRRRP